MTVNRIVSGGLRVAAGLTSWLAGQEQALRNARRASTEVSRRRIERDEVQIYLESLDTADPGTHHVSVDGATEYLRRRG